MRFLSITTVFGIFLGFGLFVYAIVSATQNYLIFWSASSLLLVLGGTLAATMISYEGRYVWKALAELFRVIVPTQIKPKVLYEEVELIIAWGKIGSRNLGLEKEFNQSIRPRFVSPPLYTIRSLATIPNMRGKLETFMNKTYERNMVRATILNMASTDSG